MLKKNPSISVVTSVSTTEQAACAYQNVKGTLFVQYKFSGNLQPTPSPSAAPTPAPTTDLLSALSLAQSNSQQQQVSLPKGAPLYIVAAGSAVFALLGIMLISARDQSDDKAGGIVYKLSPLSMIVGTALIGSAFISESFLIAVLYSAGLVTLAVVNILGRLVHVGAALHLILRKVHATKDKHSSYVNANMLNGSKSSKQFLVLQLFCLADVSLIRLMPWLDSEFAHMTSGMPSPHVFRVSSYSKLIQSALVICAQVVYLLQLLGVPSSSSQVYSLAFIGTNMAITLLIFCLNVVDVMQASNHLDEWRVWPHQAESGRGDRDKHTQQNAGPHWDGVELQYTGETRREIEHNPLHAILEAEPSWGDVHGGGIGDEDSLRGMAEERATFGSRAPLTSSSSSSATTGPRLSLSWAGPGSGLDLAPSAAPVKQSIFPPPPILRTRSMIMTRDSIPSVAALSDDPQAAAGFAPPSVTHSPFNAHTHAHALTLPIRPPLPPRPLQRPVSQAQSPGVGARPLRLDLAHHPGAPKFSAHQDSRPDP